MGSKFKKVFNGTQSYRFSHLEKGAEYDLHFKIFKHRALMWELERKVLDSILPRYLSGEINHFDFACGTGRILHHLSSKVRTAVGIDVSRKMLEIALTKAPHAELICQDITRSNVLGDRLFNLITAFRFFPNAEIELRKSAMRSIVRHLEPEGILIFNNHQKKPSAGHFFMRLLKPRRAEWTRPEEVTDLIQSVGLKILEIHHLGVLPFFDGFMPIPMVLAKSIENICATHQVGKGLAQNWIYVCRKIDLSKQVYC